MKKKVFASIVISMALILALTGCSAGGSAPAGETQTLSDSAASEERYAEEFSSESSVSKSRLSSVSLNDILENSNARKDLVKETSKTESSRTQTSKTESSYAQTSRKETSSALSESSAAKRRAEAEFEAALDELLIDHNLGEVKKFLKEEIGEKEMNETFKFYDIDVKKPKKIMVDTNWTIREWEIDDGMIYVGCEKTTTGAKSLLNTIKKIKDSAVYELLEEIDSMLDLGRDYGLIKSKN